MTTNAVSQTSLDKYLGAPLRRNKNTISIALSVIGAVGTVVAACLGHDISSLAGRIGIAAGSTAGAVALIGLNQLLNPGITEEDCKRSYTEYGKELGFEEGFLQEYESASHYYRPDFTNKEKPFKDIRDFQ